MSDGTYRRVARPRHVLITQWQMRQFTGSEMVTLELAEHLAGAGAKVTVVTHQHGGPIAELLLAAGDVELWSSTDGDLDNHLRANPPDLIWLQHQIVPDVVLSGELQAPVVVNHMSSYQPLELPLVPDVERTLATVSVFNSAETLEQLRGKGALEDFDPGRLRLFANPAPDAMAEVKRRDRPDGPLRLLLISNHVPQELSRAVAQLPADVEVVMVGEQAAKGAAPARVDADLLAQVDGVVSIGKSVQYALAVGLPVYCYDRFGGPGWLDLDNFEAARHHNFSGRGFARKDAEVIARELVDGYDVASGSADALRTTCGDELLLGPAFDELWEFCLANPRPRPAVDGGARAAQLAVTQLGRQWAIAHARAQRNAAAAAELPAVRRRLAGSAKEAAALRLRETEIRERHLEKVHRLEQRLASTERKLRKLEQSRERKVMRAAAKLERVIDAVASRVR